MIHLLFAPFDPILESIRGMHYADIFSPAEAAELDRLRVPARVREWKASRIAAKLLARGARSDLKNLPLPAIQTCRQPSGAPCLVLGDGTLLPEVFSQSHSHGYVFSGISTEDARFGVDLEWIENRSEVFIHDFFTSGEAELWNDAPPETRDALATLVWSAKEAVLKAAALGLKVDTRRVEITPQADFYDSKSWQTAGVICPDLNFHSQRVYWREIAGFIQTVYMDSPKHFDPNWVAVGD